MSTLYLLNYNNYYNRIVKKEETLSAYFQAVENPITIENVNFIPGDYVNTTQVVNIPDTNIPDYLIVAEDNQIKSRWFIIDYTRTTHNQLRLTLHRDLVVDYYDNIVGAPCFIEKALPKSIRDPAIYNSEDMTFNQIKKKEQLLYDETKCPWIVGYIPRDSFKTTTKVDINSQMEGLADITVQDLGDYEYFQYKDQVVSGEITNPVIRVMVTYWLLQKTTGGQFQNYYFNNSIKMNDDGEFLGVDTFRGSLQGYYYLQTNSNVIHVPSNQFTDEQARYVIQNMGELSSYFKNLSAYINANVTPEIYELLKEQNGKIIYVESTQQYYKVSLSQGGSGTQSQRIAWSSPLGTLMDEKLVKNFDGHSLVNPINTNLSPFSFTSDTPFQTFKIEPMSVKLETTIPVQRYQAVQSPYDIFCIPFSDELKVYKNGEVYIEKTSKTAALNIAQEIMSKVGEEAIYDVQLLPYCPARYAIQQDGTFDVMSSSFQEIKAGNSVVSLILWAVDDNVAFSLEVDIPEETDIIEKKVKNQTEFIRLVSPNFSNSFEFSPQMNEGLSTVNITCHFKPFNPYIKVQPKFRGLYGEDDSFNDGRGLICTGDYSLAQVTSAWANYELQNKNYNAAFNREIQNLKVNNSVQREREIWGIAAGTVGAGVQGGATGAMAGGPWGAIAGAAVGTVSSLAGGIRDLQLSDKLRNETLDYKRDMFGYQLGNIKALPQGLAKTSAIAPDNKFVPFVEFYGCKEEEANALRNKIIYDGATIMMIGTIQDYQREIPSYIKGKIIRIEGIQVSSYIINEIANEIDKGVFI